jgi:hypothetical protein
MTKGILKEGTIARDITGNFRQRRRRRRKSKRKNGTLKYICSTCPLYPNPPHPKDPCQVKIKAKEEPKSKKSGGEGCSYNPAASSRSFHPGTKVKDADDTPVKWRGQDGGR